MKQSVQHRARMVPAMAGASLLLAVWGSASEASPIPASDRSATLDRIDNYSNRGERELSQVNSVSQLRDVSPGNWAFEALRNLVETYGCIEGYPDRTYRGDRAVTRYEFAAGLNSCLQALEQQTVSQADLQTLQRLVAEFETELAMLNTRADNLEGRVETLEDNQFSTTTKLNGEVILGLGKAFSGERAFDALLGDQGVDAFSGNQVLDAFNLIGSPRLPRVSDVGGETVFGNRVRLQIDTSFTGRDKLSVRYQFRQMENFTRDTTGTNMTQLAFGGGGNNLGKLHRLLYQFAVADLARVYIAANAIKTHQGATRPLNPFFKSGRSGSLNKVLKRDQLVFDIPDDVSLGARFDFTDSLGLGVYYGVEGSDARRAGEDVRSGFYGDVFGDNSRGLFQGNFGTLAQLTFEPNDRIDLAFTYAHTYVDPVTSGISSLRGLISDASRTGVANASLLGQFPAGPFPTTSDRFGLQSNFWLSDSINLSLWGSYATADAKISSDRLTRALDRQVSPTVTNAELDVNSNLFSVGGVLSFLDLAKEGDRLSIGAAIPPKVTDVTVEGSITSSGNTQSFERSVEDEGTSVAIEGQYRYPLTDRIHITPGGYAVINPNHNADNDTVFVGVLRAEFAF